jgi:hypothetical protein
MLPLGRGDLSRNLFRLMGQQRSSDDRPGVAALLLYALLEADGDFARAAFRTLLDGGAAEFTRASFGALLPRSCRDLAQELERSHQREDRQHAARLVALARHIEEKTPSTERTWGGGRPRDQAATVRIEPYVDLGLITKLARTTYGYRLSGRQRGFFSELASAQSVQGFLDTSLIGSYLRGLGREPARRPGRRGHHAAGAFHARRSGLRDRPHAPVGHRARSGSLTVRAQGG